MYLCDIDADPDNPVGDDPVELVRYLTCVVVELEDGSLGCVNLYKPWTPKDLYRHPEGGSPYKMDGAYVYVSPFHAEEFAATAAEAIRLAAEYELAYYRNHLAEAESMRGLADRLKGG